MFGAIDMWSRVLTPQYASYQREDSAPAKRTHFRTKFAQVRTNTRARPHATTASLKMG